MCSKHEFWDTYWDEDEFEEENVKKPRRVRNAHKTKSLPLWD